MEIKYRLINLSDNMIKCFRSESALTSFLLGRRISNYLIIKSDIGDKYFSLVELCTADVKEIEKILKETKVF
jgi:hypothetical protein